MAAAFQPAAFAQSAHTRTLITRSVNGSELITREGNVHPAVSWTQDLGKMSDSRLLLHLRLQLKRSPEQ